MPINSAQHIAAAEGFFEPQRSYNFSLQVALTEAGDEVLIMNSKESISGPEAEVEIIELYHGNTPSYVAGRARVTPFTFSVKDFVDQGTAQACLKWWTEVINFSSGSIGLAASYKKQADLILTPGDNSVTRLYKLFGLFPTRFKHGDYDTNSSDYVKVELTLQCDRWIAGAGLNQGLSGINVGVLVPPL